MSRKTALTVSVSASVGTDIKSNRNLTDAAIKFALALCGCLGSVFSFLSCVKLPVSGLLMTAEITLLCGVFTLIFSFKKGYFGIASCVSAAGFVGTVYLHRNEICAGLASVLNIYLARGRKQYYEKPFIPIPEPELAEEHIKIFVLFAAAFICILTAYFTVRFALSVAVIPITGFPAFAVLFFGFEPSFAAFFALVSCWVGIIAMETSDAEKSASRKRRRASALCGFTAAVTAAFCLSGIYAAARLGNYRRPEKLNLIYDKAAEYVSGGGMQDTIENIVSTVTAHKVASGAINHGKLGEIDNISFNDETVLEVSIQKAENTVYLRGFVGSVYTGSSWEELSSAQLQELSDLYGRFENPQHVPLLMDSYNLEYTSDVYDLTYKFKTIFTVKNISANQNYLYMPYNLVPESVMRYIPEKGSSFSGNEDFYMGQVYTPQKYYGYQNLFRIKWITPLQLKADEALYRRFVYENYLDLPEDCTKIPEIFGDEYHSYITAEDVMTGKSTLDEMTVFNRKLLYIKRWLRDNCEYSLSAGKLPANEDFAEYFLTNRKGSCSHFATAAVLMCRYAGIPARYVEGYIIRPSDFPQDTVIGEASTIEVKDTRGHAWAEVYIDGFGWYPMEFTSGYGNIRTALPTETTASTTTASEETSETVSETTVEASSEENANSSPAPVSDQQQIDVPDTTDTEENMTSETAPPIVLGQESTVTQKPSVGFGAFGIKGSKKADVVYDLTVPIIAAVIIVLVPIIFILRRRVLLFRYRRLAADYKKGGAIAVYRRFQKLLRLMGMPAQDGMSHAEYAAALAERSPMLAEGVAEDIINTALKASFGGGILTKEEAQELMLNVNSLVKRYMNTLPFFQRLKAKYFYCIA